MSTLKYPFGVCGWRREEAALPPPAEVLIWSASMVTGHSLSVQRMSSYYSLSSRRGYRMSSPLVSNWLILSAGGRRRKRSRSRVRLKQKKERERTSKLQWFSEKFELQSSKTWDRKLTTELLFPLFSFPHPSIIHHPSLFLEQTTRGPASSQSPAKPFKLCLTCSWGWMWFYSIS